MRTQRSAVEHLTPRWIVTIALAVVLLSSVQISHAEPGVQVPHAAATVYIPYIGMLSQPPPGTAGCRSLPADNIWNPRSIPCPGQLQLGHLYQYHRRQRAAAPRFWLRLVGRRPIGIPPCHGAGQPARVAVSFDYADQSDPGPYPIPRLRHRGRAGRRGRSSRAGRGSRPVCALRVTMPGHRPAGAGLPGRGPVRPELTRCGRMVGPRPTRPVSPSCPGSCATTK